MKQAHEDKNFEPFNAEKSQAEVGFNTEQPFWTIPNYGHFGQKFDFPNEFYFIKHTFLKKARDDKNFELSYVEKC